MGENHQSFLKHSKVTWIKKNIVLFVLIWKLISIKIFDLLRSHEWMFCSFLYSRDKGQFFSIGQWMWLKLLDTNGIRFFLQISLGLLVRKVWFEHNFEKAVNRIYRDIAFIIFIYFSLNQPCSFIERSSYSDGYFNQKGQLLDCTRHVMYQIDTFIFCTRHVMYQIHTYSYIHILTDKVSACDELFKCKCHSCKSVEAFSTCRFKIISQFWEEVI